LDSTKTQLNQVDSFKVILNCFDQDASPYTVYVTSEDSILTTIIKTTYSPVCTLLVPSVQDTTKNFLKIVVVDSTGYSDTCDTNIVVRTVVPSVKCPDTIIVAAKDTFRFELKSFVNCTSFKWALQLQNITKDSGNTNQSKWEMIAPQDTGTYKIIVTPVNKYNQTVSADSSIISVKEYAYKTFFLNYQEVISVKVNRPCTLDVGLKKNSSGATSSVIKYQWSYPENVGKYITEEDSSVILKFLDVIDSFTISVKGVVGSDSVQPAVINVNVKKFAPTFLFVDSLYNDVKVNASFKVNFKTSLTDPEQSPISNYYYKIQEDKDTSIRYYDTTVGMRIGSVGTFHIEMWCVDHDGVRSKPDTATVVVSADLPYITFKSNDVLKFPINSRITISGIIVHTGASGSPVDSIYWKKADSSSVFTAIKVSENTEIIIDSTGYGKPAIITIVIKCKDNNKEESTPFEKTIEIFSDIPKIDSFTRSESSNLYKGIPVKFNIAITYPYDKSLTLRIMGLDTIRNINVNKNDTSFSLIFNKAGVYTPKAVVFDTSNRISDTVTLGSTLTVDPGNPVVNSIKIQDTLPYINDTVKCSVSAIDYNGKIKKFQYYINDTSSQVIEKTDSSQFTCTFADSGLKKIFARVVDDDGLQSEFKEISFLVRRGQPVVQNIATDKDSCFVNDTIKFTMTFYDPNGTVRKGKIAWNGDTTVFDSKSYNQNDTVRTVKDSVWHTFTVADTGWKTVKIRVQDDDGLNSEWQEKKILVKKGVPLIKSITVNKDTSRLFIGDSITFTVYVSDSNANIDSMFFFVGNTVIKSLAIDTTNICKLLYKFQKRDTILSKISIKVVDKTKFYSNSDFPIRISSGCPKVESVTITNVTGNNLFVNDNNIYRIYVSDPNNSPSEIYAAWSYNSAPVESVSVISSGSSRYGEFSHKFDTLKSGFDTLRFWVRDQDSILSKEKDTTVLVRLGRPTLWGDKNDTIWVLINNGYGNYNYKVNYFDTNGVIDTFYFGLTTNILQASKYSVNYSSITIDAANIHNSLVTRYIWVKDDDKITSYFGRFVVYADSAPPMPGLGPVTIQGDSVKFVWQNADFKDGDSTLFQIQCDTISTPVKVAKPFGTCKKSGTDFYYWFKPTASGRYYWKVTAKDARGSTSESAGSTYFDFVKP
jgi:hypothetical protein